MFSEKSVHFGTFRRRRFLKSFRRRGKQGETFPPQTVKFARIRRFLSCRTEFVRRQQSPVEKIRQIYEKGI